MAERVTPLVYVGASRATPIEALLADAQEAIARDIVDRLLSCSLFDEPIVATGSPSFVEALRDVPVRIVPDEGGFHFGRSLAALVSRFDVKHGFYVGGGAAPLLTIDELSAIATLLLSNDRVLVANNFFSSDFLGFTPAS